MLLYAATGNPGKLKEFALAGQRAGSRVQVLPVPGFERIPPCDESGSTFEENARRKAEHYSRVAGGLVFADDSGLEVAALGGAPGVHSARYAGPGVVAAPDPGPPEPAPRIGASLDVAGATDERNRQKLLAALAGVPAAERAARFVCVIALARGGEALKIFEGTAEGRILEAPRGTGGFGYDPLFFFPALGRTFAELSPEEKLAHSHRGAAFRKMAAFLGGTPPSHRGHRENFGS